MKSHQDMQQQLQRLRLRFRFFGKSEIKELRRILHHDEKIIECVYGFYQEGSGLLVATDSRILLVDKRPFYLNLEDISYERIREIMLSPSWLQATLQLHAGFTKLNFRSLSDARLRRLKEFVQSRLQEVTAEANQVTDLLQTAEERIKPYLDPAWRPHHTTILRKRKPTKFYPLNETAQLRTD